MLWKHHLATGKTLVCYQQCFCDKYIKHNTIQAAVIKSNSTPPRSSTVIQAAFTYYLNNILLLYYSSYFQAKCVSLFQDSWSMHVSWPLLLKFSSLTHTINIKGCVLVCINHLTKRRVELAQIFPTNSLGHLCFLHCYFTHETPSVCCLL